MNITTLKVGPYVYKVSDDPKLTVMDDRNILGAHNADYLKIIVRGDLPLSQKQDTLLHEVLHAVYHVAALREWGSKLNEEQVVANLTPVLLQVLQDNPKLLKYLSKKEVHHG